MLFNGNVVDPKTSMPSVHNRAFLFADGCFESMRWTDGRIPLLSLHLARLKDALVTFGMDIPEGLNLTNLEDSLQAWSQQWPWSGDVRIRLTAFREGAGAYAPFTDGVSWVATGAPLSEVGFRLPGKGLAVDVYQDAVKHASPWAKYKTLAATLYVQAARHASQQGWGCTDPQRRPTPHRIVPKQPLRGVQWGALYPGIGGWMRGWHHAIRGDSNGHEPWHEGLRMRADTADVAASGRGVLDQRRARH